MKKQPKYSPEVIERAVRMVSEAGSQYESQWAAITSIAAKIGCTPETLRRWVRQQERDTGQRPGPTTVEEERVKALGARNGQKRPERRQPLKPSATPFAVRCCYAENLYHLTTQERAVVMTMLDDQCSIRSIAKRLGRAPQFN